MVTLNFRLCDTGSVQLNISGPEKFGKILELCAAKDEVELGGVVPVRDGRILTGQALVEDTDVIDVFPAIAGG